MSKKKKAKSKDFPNTNPEEKAFRRSDGYYFNETKLEPFGFVRQSALSALLGEMGTTPLMELAAGLWLLHATDVEARMARRTPSDFVAEVEKFGDEHGITMTGKGLQAAQEVYEAICEDVRNSGGVPELKDGEGANGDEDAFGPN